MTKENIQEVRKAKRILDKLRQKVNPVKQKTKVIIFKYLELT